MRRRQIQFLLVILAVASTAHAQAPLPKFDVATVKPNVENTTRQQVTRPGGVFVAVNAPLRMLIADAYIGAQPDAISRIIGGPEWTQSARYDINAKAARDFVPTPPGPPAELLLMLRSLLEDRFKLKVHREAREFPAYELVLARPGTPGPGLRKSAVDCPALFAAGKVTRPAPGIRPTCGVTNGPTGTTGEIGLLAGGFSMSQLAQFLQRIGRPVIDKTGLSGGYDFDLSFTALGPPSPGTAADPSRPTIFIALEEQLGLKLVSTNGPLDVIVIDSIEQPVAD